MSCCRKARTIKIIKRLQRRGLDRHADALAEAAELIAKRPGGQKSPSKTHMKGAPAKVNRYYAECWNNMSDSKVSELGDRRKEYCARVAWTRYNKYGKGK